MEVVGYADKLRVQPGESIGFKVSCELPSYKTQLVRLIHGDDNPRGPGFREELIDSPVNGEYPGRRQDLHPGSHVIVPDDSRLRVNSGFTLQAWIYPTTPQKGVQGIVTKWDSSGNTGYGLFVDEDGSLALWLGDGNGKVERFSAGVKLRPSKWYFVAGVYDSEHNKLVLQQRPLEDWPLDHTGAVAERPVSPQIVGDTDADLVMAGYWNGRESGRTLVSGHFNGKIENPRLFGRALGQDDIDALRADSFPVEQDNGLIAGWDFGRDFSKSAITDSSANGLHGEAINMPTRAVTGHNWSGKELDFKRAPDEYAAIHFHDDDLEDAGWDVDFRYAVPEGLRSAVYAFKLTASESEDYIPFAVRPRKGTATARIALLLGTYTFLAYANEHLASNPVLQEYLRGAGVELEYPSTPREKYLMDNHLGGLYDLHPDGSGICYASSRKPILNLRPTHIQRTVGKGRGAPVLLAADLHQVDWLEAKGYEFDVITDEDLHFEGESLLSSYKVVMSDAHPEYWTEEMLEGLEGYLRGGGRFMYMGGNGLYWVTSVDPERPHVIEVRRWKGTGSWEADPGESFHSTTGEPGGLWRNRGRHPQKLVGIGMTAQGGGARNSAYHRQPGSFDPRAAFIFEGIGDKMIGDFESLGMGWGAAGYEFDRLDLDLGTPSHALLLATASDFDDSFHHVAEEVFHMDSNQTGTTNPLVRADMVFFEYPNGGAVFSTGSIAWSACLSYNEYDNNVSKITDNVLRKFATDGPLT